jgi:hypothetical protein
MRGFCGLGIHLLFLRMRMVDADNISLDLTLATLASVSARFGPAAKALVSV